MATGLYNYELVCASLDYLNYSELIQAFIENELDDDYLEKHIFDNRLKEVIDPVVRVARRQQEFISEFTKRVKRKSETLMAVDKFPKSNLRGAMQVVEKTTGHQDRPGDLKQERILSTTPQAIQIMDFDQTKLKRPPILFFKQELACILQKTGNRPVAVIVIAGAKRQGKSLYLNFILRHLQALQGSKACQEDDPLVGFTWKASHERVTTGMWMWSEPFTVQSKKDGTEFDILLVDTQGVFDEKTGTREWSILMGLSLLTSSCIIFNVMQNINENDLQILASFLSFGKLAMQDDHFSDGERPFQKLVYLVRDFSNPDEFPYGSEGGENFIRKVLTTSEAYPLENNAVREKIRECFHEISCILLPRPEEVVLTHDYNGSTSACKRFASEIQKSITELLDYDDIPTVKINGNTLTGQGILAAFEVYVNLFNQPGLVNPPSLYYATIHACNMAVANKCTSTFVQFFESMITEKCFLSDEDLRRSFDKAYNNSLHQYRSSPNLMGTQAAINETENHLSEQLIFEFEKLKSRNTANRIGTETTINDAVKSTVEQYVSSVSAEIENHVLTEQNFEKYHKKVSQECMQDFAAVYSLSPLFPQSSSKISEEIQNEKRKFQQQLRRAQEKINKEIDEILLLYRSQIKASTSLEKLRFTNDLAKSTALDSIRNSRTIPENEKDTFCLQLEAKLTEIHAELLQQFLINMNSMQLPVTIARAIKTTKKEYKKYMTALVINSVDFLSDSQLEEAHGYTYSKANEYLQILLHNEIESHQITEESLKSIISDLNDSISRCYATVKDNNTKRKQEVQENVKAYIQKCVKRYLELMESHLKGKLLSTEEMQDFHRNVTKMCIEDFIQITKTLQIHSNSVLFKIEHNNLAEEMDAQLKNLLAVMKTKIQKHNQDANAQVARAESIYKVNMMKVSEQKELEHFHSLHRLQAHKSLQGFKNHLNEKLIEQLSSNLEERIEQVYKDLLSSVDRQKNQLVESIAQIQKNGVASYKEYMTLLFKGSDGYLEDQILLDRHNQEKTNAMKLADGLYSKVAEKTETLEEKYQKSEVLLQVSKTIDDVFVQFQQQNNERKTTLQQQVDIHVHNKLDLYKTFMNSRMKDQILSESELTKEHKSVQQHCVELFTKVINNSTDPMYNLGLRSLVSQTNEIYTAWKPMIIEAEIKKAKEDALVLYKGYADTLITQLDGSLSDAKLEDLHKGKMAEAMKLLQNVYHNIKCSSKDTLHQKQANLVELTDILEKQYSKIVEINTFKRNQANTLLKEQVASYLQKYETAMTAKIKAQILSQGEIQEAHERIRSICVNEFSEVNKSSILVVHGRQILFEKIDERGNDFQRQMKDSIESINERGKQLVVEGISTYRNYIREIPLDTIQSFDAVSDATQRIVIDNIVKADNIPEEPFKTKFIKQLKLEIQTEYNQMRAKRLQSKEEIEKGAKRAREKSHAHYHDSIKNFVSAHNEYMEDSDLASKHKKELEKAEQCFKNYFLDIPQESEIAKEQERKGLLELRESIEQTFAQFQNNNRANKIKLKQMMNENVLRFSQEYTAKMTSRCNQEVVLGTKFETIHGSIFAAIISDFSRASSTSVLFTDGQKDLIAKINEEKARLEKHMILQDAGMNETGSSLVNQSLVAYKQKMKEVIGAETFEGAHIKNKQFQLESMKRAQSLTDKKYVDKFYSQLESQINDEYVKLLGRHYQNKQDINEQTLQSREKAKKKYEDEMQTLFPTGDKPVQNLALAEKHVLAKPNAIASLSKAYKSFKAKLNNYEAMKEAALGELEEHIDKHYLKLQEKNKLLWTASEATVAAAFQTTSQYYNEEMEKGFDSKHFFEPSELRNLSNKIAETAIIKYKKERGELSENQEQCLREAMGQAYKKYHEKNLKQYPCKNAAIGIDLGTTYTCVAVYFHENVKIIPNREFNQSPTTASYVSFRDDHTIVVGDAAKAQASRYPVDTIFDAKRLIGRSFRDEIVQKDIKLWPFAVVSDGGLAKIRVQGNLYHPEEISAKLLAKMKANAEAFLNQPVTQAVVTVPAYFTDAQRQATKDAAKIAGLTSARILNEPTAAAIAYNLQYKGEIKQRNVLIFDLGGGTFDVAVLQVKGNDIQVKATGGDTHLGGEDFDNRIVDEMIRRVKEKHGIDLARGRDSYDPQEKANASERLRRLRDPCEEAKRHLGCSSSYEIYVRRLDGDFDLKETITRTEFENLNIDLFEKCIEKVEITLNQASIDKHELDDIVLVGGSTRIPKVQQLLHEYFDGQKTFCTSINPDEAVAFGAAIHAAVINGEQAAKVGIGFKLSDVTPLPIGVKEHGGGMSVIIHKNTSVPCDRVLKRYQTTEDDQTVVLIKIYEGEHHIAKRNNFLGEFEVTGIPKNLAGREKVDCIMQIDSEGILRVTAKSCSSGSEGKITIREHKGRMLEEQIQFAKKQDPFKWESPRDIFNRLKKQIF